MKMKYAANIVFGIGLGAAAFSSPALAQTTDQAYIPGVTYQSDNPNYFIRNPFYFEGRIDWNLLKITTPSTAWEYAQRGIHNQDDLEDKTSAIADYQKAISLNSLQNGTCQLIKAAPQGFGTVTNPPPCMFTVRLRLANLLKDDQPLAALDLFKEVLTIDPLRLGVNGYIGEVYESMAKKSADSASKDAALEQALKYYQTELDMSPVTSQYTALTGDKANNAHVHWAMAEILGELGKTDEEAAQLQQYLDASQWHSDTYPWRIDLAKARLAKMGHTVSGPNVRVRDTH